MRCTTRSAMFAVALLVPNVASAAVTYLSPIRNVTTFATLDPVEGENLFSNDAFQSLEPGTFVGEALCHVGAPGDEANSSAHQLSYLEPTGILAEGNMAGQSTISEASNFAEGFGMSRLLATFSVDEATPIRILASLHAAGNGAANFTFREPNGVIYIHYSIHDGEESIDETIDLAPGTYQFTVVSSGYGQALANGSGEPAFASWTLSATFGSTTSVASIGPVAPERLAPVVAPNPVRGAARLLASAAESLVIVDLAGRVVRRFEHVGAGGVTWDSRDEAGLPVAAGVYLVRNAAGGAAARAVVVR